MFPFIGNFVEISHLNSIGLNLVKNQGGLEKCKLTRINSIYYTYKVKLVL